MIDFLPSFMIFATRPSKTSFNFPGSHNDARMCLSIAITAARLGATLANHVKITDLVKDEEGKVTGAKMTDQITGEEWTTKVIKNQNIQEKLNK